MSDDVEERINPFALFSDQVRIAGYGLTYIGHLQKDVTFCGHTFTLKTLRPSEEAAAAVAVQPWHETLVEPAQWANAIVGLALVSVDGETAFCPPAGPNINDFATGRLNYITNPDTGWHKPTLGFLYGEYLKLEQQALEAVQELQNLSERSPAPSQPSPDSLTAQGSFEEPMSSDIQP